MKADIFFTEADKKRIAETVRKVETSTSGEVAVMVVDASDAYPEGQMLAGATVGGLVALGLTDLYFADSLWTFLLLFLGLSLTFGWLTEFLPEIKRFFTPKGRIEIQVQDKALRAFYEEGLYQTRDATGVLFFISLFEHRVWILADKGIYEKIAPEELQAYADDIARGVKTGTATDALCREMEKIGAILTEHFPIKPDDINELDNEVIVG
ncbi:TPM domain-containing protein [Thermodesulfobacteriota bacterium]